MSNYESIELLSIEDLHELNNNEILAYRKRLHAHGSEVEEYILSLRVIWDQIEDILKDRIHSLEQDCAEIQRTREELLVGSLGEHDEHIIH